MTKHSKKIDKFVSLVRDIYGGKRIVPLYEPTFDGDEKVFVDDAIDSTFVSSVGKYVDEFEKGIEKFTGTSRAVATVNGTSALHASLHLAGVQPGDLVITQALTFVATCNAISMMGARPVLVDIDLTSYSLCPQSMERWLDKSTYLDNDGNCRTLDSDSVVRAVVPMHTFGHPADISRISGVAERWNLEIIEDAAESLGSLYQGVPTGTFGRFGALSFNGNKIITTGGGGMILCNSEADGLRAKHVTTTAKRPHSYEFFHDELGFNYRMPNLNAALGVAQLANLNERICYKRELAQHYANFFSCGEYSFILEPSYARSNYWLNAVLCEDLTAKTEFLERTNAEGVMTRPAWTLMHHLPMYKDSMRSSLKNCEWAVERLVNIPSCVNGTL